MKNFKGWWSDKEMKDYLWGDYEAHEDTWKAALEWVLDSEDEAKITMIMEELNE